MEAVNNIDIYKKKYSADKNISISTYLSAFSGFLKFFFFIFLLELFRFIIGSSENFQFDIIDLSISLMGFLFKSLITFSNAYQKQEERTQRIPERSYPKAKFELPRPWKSLFKSPLLNKERI